MIIKVVLINSWVAVEGETG